MSITAAAVWSVTPSGIGTRMPAGSTRASAYDPGGAAGIGHPVAGLDDRDAGADRLDDPGRLAPQPARQGERVQPGPVVGVDEVDPDGGVPDPGLALAGLADLDVLPAQDFGAAGLGDADGFRHVVLPLSPSARITSCDQDA